jgi:uncharacterized phage infection (PIP) family protein YhgE
MNPSSLPPQAQEKFRALSLAANDAGALAQSTLGSLDALQTRMGEAQNAADSASDDIRREQATKTVESLKRQAEVLTEVFQRRQAEHAAAMQIVNQVEFWLGKLPPETRIEMVEPGPPPVLRDGETIAQAVERIRAELAEVEKNLHATRQRPLPAEDLRIMAARHIAGRAAKGRPKLWCQHDRLRVEFTNPNAWNPGDVDAFTNLLCWYDAEGMVERLCAEVDQQIKGGDDALSGPERERLISQLTARRYRAEADEESLIEMAALQGLNIPRRMNASPPAILRVKVVSRNEMVAA